MDSLIGIFKYRLTVLSSEERDSKVVMRKSSSTIQPYFWLAQSVKECNMDLEGVGLNSFSFYKIKFKGLLFM